MGCYERRADLDRPATETDISQKEFFLWSGKVQALRKKYLAREILENEFLERLSKK
jgi:hypothetical protein